MGNERKAEGWRRIDANVGGKERLASMFLGGGLIAFALTRRRPVVKLLALPGAMLFARGRSGRSLLYTLFDVSTSPETPARRQLGEARPSERAARGAEETATAAQAPAAEGEAAMHSEPTAESPHPRVPGTHEHPVPTEELGVPSVQVTEKLMSEVAAGAPGEAAPESES